ncbi:hypothetical protein K501DRAFT_269688 [Backusella circina FSU 941]|nr:hypothetical protein K501DRAFT_269688 [Backusella circina FSU 941]
MESWNGTIEPESTSIRVLIRILISYEELGPYNKAMTVIKVIDVLKNMVTHDVATCKNPNTGPNRIKRTATVLNISMNLVFNDRFSDSTTINHRPPSFTISSHPSTSSSISTSQSFTSNSSKNVLAQYKKDAVIESYNDIPDQYKWLLPSGASMTNDKYPGDGSVKLPKVLKGMICAAVDSRPNVFDQIKVIDFIVVGTEAQMLADVPEGKVFRISRANVFTFCNPAANIINGLKSLFQMVRNSKTTKKKTQQ